ncbi:Uncharacterized protein PRO82_000021 [Candidatus Protochlamydia amoebophila]|uniref:hypothetical protein n=1 Tax=Candidatus Protochlamydia amoebophila TaxID=362787 RepID=UPI001BCA15E2|nr:hypothetical protein [Candidatus Protochlamydia amoebophila]MBS4162744.1 Uncharacterized protein [Candidatus Protochlamydia amoebophila]
MSNPSNFNPSSLNNSLPSNEYSTSLINDPLSSDTTSSTREVQTNTKEIPTVTEGVTSEIFSEFAYSKDETQKSPCLTEQSVKSFVKGKFLCAYNKKLNLRASELESSRSFQGEIRARLNDQIHQTFSKKIVKLWIKTCHENISQASVELIHLCQTAPITINYNDTIKQQIQSYQDTQKKIEETKTELNVLNRKLTNINKKSYNDNLKELEALEKIQKNIAKVNDFLSKLEQLVEKYQTCNLKTLDPSELNALKEELSHLKEFHFSQLKKEVSDTITEINNYHRLQNNKNKFQLSDNQLNIKTKRVLDNLEKIFADETPKDVARQIEECNRCIIATKKDFSPYTEKLQQIKEETTVDCRPTYEKLLQKIRDENSSDLYPEFIAEIKKDLASQDPVIRKDAQQTLLSSFDIFEKETLKLTRNIQKGLPKDENEIIPEKDYDALQTHIKYLKEILELTQLTSSDAKLPQFKDHFKGLFALIPDKTITVKEANAKLTLFNQADENLTRLVEPYRGIVKKAYFQSKQELEKQKPKIQENIKILLQQLKEKKADKKQIINNFIEEVNKIQSINFSDLIISDVEQIQDFVDIFLGHYLEHSEGRFPKVLDSHRDFALRVSNMFEIVKENLSNQQLEELQSILKDFLSQHVTNQKTKLEEGSVETLTDHREKALEKTSESEKPLYRKVQAMHETEDEFSVECQMVGKKVESLLPWLFGKGCFASPQAAHLAPFPGIVSWDLNYLTSLFNHKFGLTLPTLEKNDQAELFNEDVAGFVKTIQSEGKVDNGILEKELIQRYADSKEEEQDTLHFIFNALVFLSRISSLEMSETRHLPEFFNQEMDKVSETLIKGGEQKDRGYKLLLGEAFIDLLISPEDTLFNPQQAGLSEKHIEYLQATVNAVSERLEQLASKKQKTGKLAPLEFVECHALHSIYLGIEKICEERKLPAKILENKEHIFENTNIILYSSYK